MILDNAPGHPEPHEFNIKSVEVVYLPTNTMSLTQPLDQGVIRTFNVHCTQYSMKRTVSAMGENHDRWSIMTESTKYYTELKNTDGKNIYFIIPIT